ncbi:SDR family NAD(P)-dependent oxidoreductase [Mycobacteroides chelonae]|jgi:NAD(P)-dependent dehydrogenase (short-subunit alcohol dehydrogenase family)|uniref:Ketoreductase domain-containing protein n=1 Tax=Mycobacteroides chelonae TaxID=1774 RepID=A0A1S1KG00_MYCCH|nr:SDR family NAD(P)-dependent oxidoreductase [Mycobacteroides chelonae]MBF9328123.1 SDR family NAD(P)-dependent oxidoreductase [Mycobacteroides chelonae]MBF9422301.1 SDR family NAD(P)-dependent oxidoreductase [Mycobacteroides chelonae]MBF9435551.1 SDR family NAD(P)-dependent oxidoreductase [Mycobacteroides chelonae]MBV6362175.1 SDR family NAD(P)-dependent oxidoreductase [Mycobacteroides chelonae]MEC4858744.1 SDR family NAD(P)-dependent oxidoreductase [Mycobacteroides chelonae]
MKIPQRVVITGAASGIGTATVQHYARAGTEVIGLDINEDALQAAAGAARHGGGRVFGYACDVADLGSVEEASARIKAEHGPVDILVNNAGVGVGGDFLETTHEDWIWLRSINYDGVAHGCRAFGPDMVARGSGHVVNVASGAGYIPTRRMASYCASKAAVIMFSRCLRADWAGRGVGVSVICPGVIKTPILEHTRLRGAIGAEKELMEKGFKLGHPPDAVAKAIARAARHNLALVPVGVESRLAYHALRALPASVGNLLARV